MVLNCVSGRCMTVSAILLGMLRISLSNSTCNGATYTGTMCIPSQLRNGSNCRYDVLMNDFPSLYTIRKFTPGSPSVFSVNIHGTASLMPSSLKPSEASFVFAPPSDGSIAFLQGFELSLFKIPGDGAGVPETQCIVFDITSITPLSLRDYGRTFEFRCPLASSTTYYAELYSLPKPPNGHDAFKKYIISTPMKFDLYSTSPADWVTTISFTNYTNSGRGCVDVNFMPPPPQYGFVHFVIAVVDPKMIKVVRSETIDTFSYTFEDLDPGIYTIWIYPIDHFDDDDDRCLCKAYDNECTICMVTTTQPFVIALDNANQFDNMTDHQTVNGSENWKLGMIITGVAFVFVFLIVLAIVLFIKCNVNKKRTFSHFRNIIFRKKNSKTSKEKFPCIKYEQKQLVKLEKIRILLIHYEDHTYFDTVVNRLAEYLQMFLFEVVFAPFELEEIQTIGVIQWTEMAIKQADCIIIVNSEAAFNRYKMYTHAKRYNSDPIQDIFVLSVSCMFNDRRFQIMRRKCMMVRFSYTDKRYVLYENKVVSHYQLLRQFGEMIKTIGLMTTTSPMQMMLLNSRSEVMETHEYFRLAEAVNNAIRYDKNILRGNRECSASATAVLFDSQELNTDSRA